MGKLLRFGPTILWLFTGLPLQAHAQTTINSLSLNPAWLTLIHYQPNTFGSGFTSQADDPAFFISRQGKTSPKAELNATLEAIQQPGEGNRHARCRFPARDTWLREQLELSKSPISCPDYEAWTDTLNTESITLVFAASYLNSPSSMFGHTFLRLDPPQEDEQTSLLLANTISYAADAPEQDNELLFIYQGVFGGYPGTTTVQPYYEKIRLYSDIEHRDLWEYELNLTKQEVDSMLAHAWEIQGRNFDYFFFDENCAYRLLALIDAARPGTELLEQVTTHAIPSDTVRWAVDKDLVANVHYRPSTATSVAYSLSNLPRDHQGLAAAIANGDIAPNNERVQSLAPKKKANLLDATYDYVRYRSEADDWPTDIAAPLSHALLLERSKIDGVAPPKLPPEPRVRDDQGHDTFRVSLSAGQLAHREFTQLTFRPAYHDVLDPPAGYRSGAQLQFFRLDARLYRDNDELQLEQLTGLEIRSLSPRNAFFSPLSWQVGFGGRRTDNGNKRVFAPYLEGGAGGSWSLGQQTQAFAIATADLEIDDDLRRGYDAAPGADIGLLHQNNYFSFSGGVKTKAWIVSSQHRQDQLYARANWHIGREFSLFAEFTREDHYDRYQSTWQAGLHAYF
ncbi:MAG: Lnb N-terminal periplasmic domain-containing protein [Marinobacter sp.]|uniref:Lnb N-terminal periplasmic domain-containing protein n=1 Tax=Marinobacter sp. TaxID=50741 RepID=UPI003F9956EF